VGLTARDCRRDSGGRMSAHARKTSGGEPDTITVEEVVSKAPLGGHVMGAARTTTGSGTCSWTA